MIDFESAHENSGIAAAVVISGRQQMIGSGHITDYRHHQTPFNYAAGAGAGAGGAVSSGGAGASSAGGVIASGVAGVAGEATPHPSVLQPVVQPPQLVIGAQQGWHEPQLCAGAQDAWHALQLGAGALHGWHVPQLGAGVLHASHELAQ